MVMIVIAGVITSVEIWISCFPLNELLLSSCGGRRVRGGGLKEWERRSEEAQSLREDFQSCLLLRPVKPSCSEGLGGASFGNI